MSRIDINIYCDALVRVCVMNLPPVENVLDIGSGPCLFQILYPYLDTKITFLDKSDSDGDLFNKARNILKKNKRFNFVEATADNMPMIKDNTYDMVTFLNVIEHLTTEDQHKCLKEIKRVLKPEGILVISTPNREGRKLTGKYLAHPGHIEEFSNDELQLLLSSHGFVIKRARAIIKAVKVEEGFTDISPIIHDNMDEAYVLWAEYKNVKKEDEK